MINLGDFVPMKGKKNLKKNLLLSAIVALPVISVVLCIILFVKMGVLEDYIKSNNRTEVVYDTKNSPVINENVNVITNDRNIENEIVSEDSSLNEQKNELVETNDYAEYDGIVKVCLTFDDGPSGYTDDILDILDDYGIKATFFINGHEGYEDALKRIVAEGHSIGMHSYSHSYRQVYKNLDSFADDLYEIQSYIYETTGVVCDIYRFPGGSSNHVSNMDMTDCIDYLHAKGIEYYDWNVSASDAVVGGASVNTIVNNVMREISGAETDTIIILLHDSGDKRTTVEALPIIIEKIADMSNVAFVPITDGINPIHHVESAN